MWPHERSRETVLSGGPKSSSADAPLRGFRRVSDLDDPARGGIGGARQNITAKFEIVTDARTGGLRASNLRLV